MPIDEPQDNRKSFALKLAYLNDEEHTAAILRFLRGEVYVKVIATLRKDDEDGHDAAGPPSQ